MCFGALDVKITEPAAWEESNSSIYYKRKCFFALNVQKMGDQQYIFTFLSCLSPVSTHDNTAYASSGLCKLLEGRGDGFLAGFWIDTDDGYTCMNRLLTPWPGKSLSVAKNCFNY